MMASIHVDPHGHLPALQKRTFRCDSPDDDGGVRLVDGYGSVGWRPTRRLLAVGRRLLADEGVSVGWEVVVEAASGLLGAKAAVVGQAC